MDKSSPKWFCAQIGAREHYSVPRVLYQKNDLAVFYTDFWGGAFTRKLAKKTNSTICHSLAARFHPNLVNASVVSWNWHSLFWEFRLRHAKKHDGIYGPYFDFIEIGRRFSIRVREALKQRHDLNSHSIFFAYDTGALEALQLCRERGIKCVLNQMDPNRVEADLVREEEKQWPDWKTQSIQAPEEYFQRREKEWALADRVVVNSDFCREALIRQGVHPEKLVTIPLCYEPESREMPEIKIERPEKMLRVLFLGQVILRKGIQYLIQAAKLLENVRFDVVGPIGISSAAIKSAPANVIFHGRATRNQTAAWYRQSDVFVLPTLSDGFAITQLEAMSHGLPVVTTPCCGAVVSDGVDGFIVPPRDAEALAKALQRYLKEPKLLQDQRFAAREKVKQFSLNRLGENLHALGQALVKNQ